MAKRFTDTEKWKDSWFLELEPTLKILWIYLLDSCDHAGIWKVDFRLASFCVGSFVDKQSTLNAFSSRVNVLSEDKWHVPKFIAYQYKGKLNPSNKAHKGVINALVLNEIDPSPFVAPCEDLPRCTGIGTGEGVGIGLGILNSSSEKFDPRKHLDVKKILSSDSSQENLKEISPRFTPDHVVQLWNESMGSKYGHAVGLGSGKHLTNCLEALKHLPDSASWENLFAKCEESKHLRGENDIGWTVTLTWIVNFDNALRVLSDEFNDGKNIKNLFAGLKSEVSA